MSKDDTKTKQTISMDEFHCSDHVRDLQRQDEKIENRSTYVKADGYRVKVRVTYTRTRKIRATSEEQAKLFGAVREAKYAPRGFHKQNLDYEIENIEPVEAVRIDPEDDDE